MSWSASTRARAHALCGSGVGVEVGVDVGRGVRNALVPDRAGVGALIGDGVTRARGGDSVSPIGRVEGGVRGTAGVATGADRVADGTGIAEAKVGAGRPGVAATVEAEGVAGARAPQAVSGTTTTRAFASHRK
jgi:hypothetical protein